MLRILFYYLLFLCCTSSSLFSNQSNDKLYVKEQLKHIPHHDKQALTLFFETLLTQNFAYTLFGDKPVSEDGYFSFAYGDRSRKQTCLSNGMRTWKRYSHLFPSDNFAFKFEQDESFDFVYLINKKSFIATANKYFLTFQDILGKPFDPEQLLVKILTTNTPYAKALNNHSGLIGLLFGFGYTNAFLYFQNERIYSKIEKIINPPFNYLNETLSNNELNKMYKHPLRFFKQIAKKPPPGIQIPQELRLLFSQKENLENKLKPFPPAEDPLSLSSLTLFPLPAFGADFSCKETQMLFDDYTKMRHEIMQAYSQGDFLEVTLCKLIEK